MVRIFGRWCELDKENFDRQSVVLAPPSKDAVNAMTFEDAAEAETVSRDGAL